MNRLGFNIILQIHGLMFFISLTEFSKLNALAIENHLLKDLEWGGFIHPYSTAEYREIYDNKSGVAWNLDSQVHVKNDFHRKNIEFSYRCQEAWVSTPYDLEKFVTKKGGWPWNNRFMQRSHGLEFEIQSLNSGFNYGAWFLRKGYFIGSRWENKDDYGLFGVLDRGRRSIFEFWTESKLLEIYWMNWLQLRQDDHFGVWDASLRTVTPRIGSEISVPLYSHVHIYLGINFQKLQYQNVILDQTRLQIVQGFKVRQTPQHPQIEFLGLYELLQSTNMNSYLSFGKGHHLLLQMTARQKWTEYLWFACYYTHSIHHGIQPIGRTEGVHRFALGIGWQLGTVAKPYLYRRDVFDDAFDRVVD